jgi:hypothetical protein
VEQLMIIAGRAEIFGMTLTLATLLLFLRDDLGCWVLGCITYTVGMFFKESVLITPLLLIFLYAYERRPPKHYVLALPLFLLALPYLWIRHAVVGPILTQWQIGYMIKFFVEAFPQVLLIYVRLIFIPWNLHSHRLMPHLTHSWPLLLVILIGLPIVLSQRKARLGLLGFGWFVAMLLPKTPIMVYGSFMLDHWAYPAAVGIFLPLASGFARAWDGRHKTQHYWLGMIFFPLLIFWALLVHLNVALRGTDEKMYRWALHFTDSHPIQYNLGVLLLQTGRPQEAAIYFENVRATYPEDTENLRALALAYEASGHPNIARLLRLDPTLGQGRTRFHRRKS